MNEEYKGKHLDAYNQLRWDIPNLMRQTVIDNSIKLGLPYDEGWRFPLTVGFTDEKGYGAENLFAYVRVYSDGKTIKQELNINVDSYVKKDFDHEKVFAHELVHAMMNDALGTHAVRVLPRWLHEGLAVYGSDEGEKMVTAYVHQNWGWAESKLINGLEGPHGFLDYAEDYLAIKYIVSEHGSNALPLFLTEIIRRGGDVKGAYEYCCHESWAEFLENYQEFAKEEIADVRPPRKGKPVRSY